MMTAEITHIISLYIENHLSRCVRFLYIYIYIYRHIHIYRYMERYIDIYWRYMSTCISLSKYILRKFTRFNLKCVALESTRAVGSGGGFPLINWFLQHLPFNEWLLSREATWVNEKDHIRQIEPMALLLMEIGKFMAGINNYSTAV